ncbi:hypothetical protein [Stenotrophomonas geniculata]|uniref:hypothetical protein n=1 Tax=Stenotrophomonas geniculata TaxID=86188 RepID=UPI002ACE2968|nr:hypothetical protein [Stenotrophomonas geniculata]
MTTHNTGNPVPSAAVKDLYDNAENLDSGINGDAPTWVDRKGRTRKSMAGVEQDFAKFLADGSTIEFPTWAAASAAASAGQIPLNRQVAVIGDGGTHTDPVSGLTVSNSGRYVMVAAGLQWRDADVMSQKANRYEVRPAISQVDPLTDAVRSGMYDELISRAPTALVASSVGYSSWTQAFDVGTDIAAGASFDGVRAQLQLVAGTTQLRVSVWRRSLAVTTQDRAGPGLAGDVLISRKSVPVSDLGLTVGLASRVWVPIPVVIAEAGYTYLVTLDARDASDAALALGMGYLSATGLSQRRMGYYLSTPSAGFWSNMGAGSALAWSLGAAQLVKSAELDARATSLETFKAAIDRVIPSAPQTVAALAGESAFTIPTGRYTWAIGIVGGLDVPAGIVADGVNIPLMVEASTAKVSVWLYSRPRGAAWEVQSPGFSGDVLVASAQGTVDDLGIVPGAPSMATVNLPLSRFTVEAGTMYYLVVEAQDAGGARLLSAITYHSAAGLAPDQYRKFWRSGPVSSWSNGASSTTYRFAYDLTLTGYQLDQDDKGAEVWLGDSILEATARWQGAGLRVKFTASRSGGKRALDTTVSLAPLTGGSVTDEPITLRAAGGTAKTWSYMRDRVAHAALTGVVVKDAGTGGVLGVETDYWSIPALGAFSLPGTSGAERAALVSYSWKARRYDLVVYTPLTGAVSVVTGVERVRDASEFVPAPGVGQMALFAVDVEARVILPVWDNAPEGVKRQSMAEFSSELARNRRLLMPVLRKLRQGLPLKVLAYGDSNFAQMGGPYSLAAVRSSANTVFHDRTKDVGGLLANPPYGADVLATVPVYDTGDGAGAVHTRFGMVWELVRALQAGYGSNVTLSNRSIPGSTSANATYQGQDTVRLAAAVADVGAGDLVLVGFGQNELGQASTRSNIIAICQAFQAVGAAVVVVGCFRPNANDLNAVHTYGNWRYTQRALREAAYACGAAYISTEMLYDDAVAGAIGLSANDFSAATFDVHPGPREHNLLGKRLASWLD